MWGWQVPPPPHLPSLFFFFFLISFLFLRRREMGTDYCWKQSHTLRTLKPRMILTSWNIYMYTCAYNFTSILYTTYTYTHIHACMHAHTHTHTHTILPVVCHRMPAHEPDELWMYFCPPLLSPRAPQSCASLATTSAGSQLWLQKKKLSKIIFTMPPPTPPPLKVLR